LSEHVEVQMGNYWLLLVIIASLSHAFWNIMLKQNEDKTIFLWSLRVWSVILFLPVSIVLWPKDEHITWEWVLMGLGSILLHSFYALILSKAYEKNDFTLTYPIARGLGPLIVVAVGVTLFKEPFTWMSIVGSVLIFTGIFVLYTGLGRGGQSIRSMFTSPYPLLVGLSIAGYTLFDKLAVSIVHPVSLNVIENMGQVLLLGSLQVRGWERVRTHWKKYWGSMAIAGGLAGLSYVLVLIVLTEIPVSYVAPVRETSIVIGSFLGIYFLKERFQSQKIWGAVLIFAGVVCIVM